MLARLRITASHLSRTSPLTPPTSLLNASSMSTFSLPNSSPAIEIRLPSDLTQDQLLNFPAFKTWISALRHNLALQKQDSHVFHKSPYSIRNIEVQAVDWFGPKKDKLGFVKLKAEITNDDGENLPGSVFLRGGSVAMLLILQPDDVPEGSEKDKYAILTVQPRIPASSLSFAEIPAGMLEDGTLKGAAMKEIQEETGLDVKDNELTNLSELALQNSPQNIPGDEQLQAAAYPSPGGSDEYIPVFLAQKRIKRQELDSWKGKLTGLRDEGEKITLTLCRLEDLWKVGARDGKTLAAWALYDGLKKERKI